MQAVNCNGGYECKNPRAGRRKYPAYPVAGNGTRYPLGYRFFPAPPLVPVIRAAMTRQIRVFTEVNE